MSPATQALHFQLLRLAKGALKAWETWLRSQTNHTSDHTSDHTPKPTAV